MFNVFNYLHFVPLNNVKYNVLQVHIYAKCCMCTNYILGRMKLTK